MQTESFIDHTTVCTTNDVAAILRTLEEGKSVEPHWHNFFEFELVLSGKMIHKIGDKEYVLSRGDAYLISSNGFHSMDFPEETSLVNLGFRAEFVDDALRHFSGIDLRTICGSFSEEEIKQILLLCEQINTELDDRKLLNTTIISGIIAQIIIMLLRVSPTKQLPDNTNKLVQRALAYINEHFAEDLSLEEIARSLSITPNYLGKIFKSSLGYSFNYQLNKVRLKNACKLLLSTNEKTSEIAKKSGYKTPEHFYLTFKKMFGIKPSEYKQSNVDKKKVVFF